MALPQSKDAEGICNASKDAERKPRETSVRFQFPDKLERVIKISDRKKSEHNRAQESAPNHIDYNIQI